MFSHTKHLFLFYAKTVANQAYHKITFKADRPVDAKDTLSHFDYDLQPLADIALRAATSNGDVYSIGNPSEHRVNKDLYPAVYIGRAMLRLLLSAEAFKSQSRPTVIDGYELFEKSLDGNRAQACNDMFGWSESSENARIAMRYLRLDSFSSEDLPGIELTATTGIPETDFYRIFAATILANNDELPAPLSSFNSLSIIAGEVDRHGFLGPPTHWASPFDCLGAWADVLRL